MIVRILSLEMRKRWDRYVFYVESECLPSKHGCAMQLEEAKVTRHARLWGWDSGTKKYYLDRQPMEKSPIFGVIRLHERHGTWLDHKDPRLMIPG